MAGDEILLKTINGSIQRNLNISIMASLSMFSPTLNMTGNFTKKIPKFTNPFAGLSSIEDFFTLLNDEEKETIRSRVGFYMIVYLLLGLVLLLFSLIASLIYAFMIKRSCRIIHSGLIGKIILFSMISS